MSRVYVPATLELLAQLASGSLPSSVERLVPDSDSEEAEYAALMEAAAASRELLGGRGRRVVVVAELPAPDDAVPLERVVAVHVDDTDDADEDDEPGWYATQEIPDLLA